MRLTEFTELMTEEFGAQSADSILLDHVLIDFGGRTGAQAIDDGIDPQYLGQILTSDPAVKANFIAIASMADEATRIGQVCVGVGV